MSQPVATRSNGSDAISIAIRRLSEGSDEVKGHEVTGTCSNGHRSGRWSVHTFTVHTEGSTALIGVLQCPPRGGPLISFSGCQRVPWPLTCFLSHVYKQCGVSVAWWSVP